MSAALIWLWGVLTLGSAMMVASWGHAMILLARHGSWRELVWSKAFVIATGLTIHAVCMALLCGYRAAVVLRQGVAPDDATVPMFIVGLCGMALSKVLFVWAGALSEVTRRVRWPWWAFLYSMILWGIFCITWGGGKA